MRAAFYAAVAAALEKIGVAWPGGAANMRVRRTGAGRHQRSAGAWVWVLETADGSPRPDVGGYDPATSLARRPLAASRSGFGGDVVVEAAP